MKLERYLRTFPESELVKGTELYLSGELLDLRVTKGNDPVKLAAGSFVWHAAGQQKRIDHTAVSARFRAHDQQTPVLRECSLVWLTAEGVMHRCSCGCPRFQEDGFVCEHVAALLTALLVREEGEDILRGTAIEEGLRQTAMVEDPFLPGILQRTDGRLLSLLHRTDLPELPTWHKAERRKEQMGLDIVFSETNAGRVSFQLKLGYTRHYQITDLPGLLTAYRNRAEFPFGKNSCQVAPENCEPFAEKVLTYLSGLHTAWERGLYKQQLFHAMSYGSASLRFMSLSGKQLDELL